MSSQRLSPYLERILRGIAPDGCLEEPEQAYVLTAALLRSEGVVDPELVRLVAEEIEQYCRRHGIWGVREGRRVLRLPLEAFPVLEDLSFTTPGPGRSKPEN